ncbi:hypothetical protein Tco_1452656 [Tanacetum coccineum]
MVVFLEKPTESAGFEEIVDFLNAHPIRTQIHALVDGKKIVITESSVRRDLQLADEEVHKRTYIAPFHTKNIFANMKRIGKGFSGNVTPLFPSMVVQSQSQMGEGSTIPTDPQHTPTFIPSTSQPQKTQKPRKPKRQDTKIPQSSSPIEPVADEAVYKERDDSLVRAATTTFSLEAKQDSVSTHFDADTDMFGVHDLVGDEVVVETEVASKDVNLSVDEVTLAQALAALKSVKPKADKVMLQELEQGTITTTTAATTVTAASTRPKAKGFVIHEQEQAPTPTVSS